MTDFQGTEAAYDPTTEISVTDSALPGNLAAGARQVLLAVGGWAVGKGYLDNSTLAMLATVSAVLGPFLYGQWKQYESHREKRTLAITSPIGKLK